MKIKLFKSCTPLLKRRYRILYDKQLIGWIWQLPRDYQLWFWFRKYNA